MSVLGMVIDGMGKSKFKVPRNLDTKVGSNKLWDECGRPTCPMTGVLVHGVAEHYYILDDDMKKDSNMNCELIARSLDKAAGALAEVNTQMPVHFALQADNTCREEKNTVALTQLAVLVGQDRFKSATASFAGVGHSHIDIDQRFSDVSTKLKNTCVLEEPADFQRVVKEKVRGARGRAVESELVPDAHDWKHYYAPLGIQLHGHTGNEAAHVFKFIQRQHLAHEGADGLVVDRSA